MPTRRAKAASGGSQDNRDAAERPLRTEGAPARVTEETRADHTTTVEEQPHPPEADRLHVFVEVAEVVHGPSPLQAKLDWVLHHAAAATGATHAAFVQLAGDEHDLVVVAGDPAVQRAGEPAMVEIIRRTVRGGAILRLEPGVGRVRRARTPHGPVFGELLAVPVPRRDDRPHGALVLGGADGARFAGGAEPVVEALAVHLGVALDNLTTVQRLAELEAARKEVVHQLQEAVRPPMPVVPETELGIHYLPADPHAPTGGDLYDWQLLPDGDLHLVVVDVLGKGVAATKDALAITHVLRLLVLDGVPLERLVARADALLSSQNPDLVATLLVARYTPTTGVLRLAGAGHPPLLLVDRDGHTREVAAPGIPLGWPGAGSAELVTVTLDRSETAIFYTDGLIEATKDIIEGLDNLARAAGETARYPAPHLARTLVERALAGAERRDDTLALVLRRRSPPAVDARHPLGPFEYRFSPSTASVGLVRSLLADWLVRQPLDPIEVDDLVLVASELCANAVRAASGAPGALVLRASIEADAVVLEVEDDGSGLDRAAVVDDPDELPDPSAEQGRGLFLVSALTDDVDVRRTGDRTVIRATKRGVVGQGTNPTKNFVSGG